MSTAALTVGLPAPKPLRLGETALFLDLDGTLAPIAARPQDVRPDPRRTSLLERLAERLDGRLAVVSGRTLADIDRILEGCVTSVAAVHGLVLRHPDGRVEATPAHPNLTAAIVGFRSFAERDCGLIVEEKGLSVALHFRLAFRRRSDAPYTGRDDGPAYDYFTGFPAYDTSDGPTPAAARAALFNLKSGGLPVHLTDALMAAMADVHPDGPKILTQDPQYSAKDGNGALPRPNAAAMAEMWSIVYGYLKMTGKDGLSPRMPQPPDVFTDHSFPTPPGGSYGVDDDPTRGADVDHNDSFNLLDLLLALFAWAVYLAQVIIWLATILPGLILDITTFPAREVIYYTVLVPAWNLYMLSRRALVMSGFLMPKPEEVDPGLTILGSSGGSFSISSALDDPLGLGLPVTLITEPSGRLNATTAFGLDPAYPRNIVRDHPADVSAIDLVSALGLTSALRYAGDAGAEFKPSEWIAPWRYPLKNQAGQWVPQEGAPAHVGPYVSGQDSTVLLSAVAGDDNAREKLEGCGTPQDTFAALDALLPLNAHLGGPMDYGTYLVGRMAGERQNPEFTVPDFNLDSDRGYAWHCWDWDRHNLGRNPAAPGALGAWECVPNFTPVALSTGQTIDFSYPQPCTPPQFFHADHDNPRQASGGTPADAQWYEPHLDLKAHYLSRAGSPPPEKFGDDPCGKSSKTHELNLGQEWPHGPLGGGR